MYTVVGGYKLNPYEYNSGILRRVELTHPFYSVHACMDSLIAGEQLLQ